MTSEKANDRPRGLEQATVVAAPALLLLSPLVSFLYFHYYPALHRETLILLLLALGGGVAYGGLLLRVGPIARTLLLWPFVVLVLDLPFDLGVRGAALVAVVGLGPALALRRHLPALVAVMSASFLLTVPWFGPRVPAPTPQLAHAVPTNDRPAVIHLILDEHIGLNGLPEDIPEAIAFRRELDSVLTRWRFRYFRRAYSRYFFTHNAVANVLNMSAARGDQGYVDQLPDGVEPWRLKGSSYLQVMAEDGYAIHVYQSDYFDLCHIAEVRIGSCVTYPSNVLRDAADWDIGAGHKAALVLAYLLENRSHIYQRVHQVYSRTLRPILVRRGFAVPAWEWSGNRVGGARSLAMLNLIVADLAERSHGKLILAHLLATHYPYEVDAECHPHPTLAERLDRNSPAVQFPYANTPDSRAVRYRLYLAQLRCTWRYLGAFFGRLDSLGILSQATVILQGDHGSRIALRDPYKVDEADLTAADFTDGFSTLFAVRTPAIRPGPDDALQPSARLLARLVTSEFRSLDLPPTARNYVLITGDDLRLIAVPLPPSAIPETVRP